MSESSEEFHFPKRIKVEKCKILIELTKSYSSIWKILTSEH